ncbi:MAG: hypothetical protein FWB91_02465 [Defluviitaleaceae bacterium]|nr:hypothetical protein [Defluviitaleaceae bacterium]
MNLPITITDIIFAALFAGVIVFIFHVAGRMFHTMITRNTVFSLGSRGLSPEQLKVVKQRCYRLFPIESLLWDGTTFTRGSTLHIVTDKNENFVGQFMGTNNENMVCIVTDESIVAQQINTITEIRLL